MNFCIYGAGAWGTALAIHLHRLGHVVTLLPRRLEHAAALATARENADYLPGFHLHPDIQIACETRPALMEAGAIVFACPSRGLREAASRLAPDIAGAGRAQVVISLVKGLEQGTLLRPLQVLDEVLPGRVHSVLSGPTYAGEIAAGEPSAAVFATDAGEATASNVQEALNGGALRIYRSADPVGVQLGGILKNIYAIGAGICDGLRLGSNAKASYLTRAIQEMVRLGTVVGGKPETFYGLSGVGDLIATAHGSWSRNRKFGESLVRTVGAPEASLPAHRTTEGYWATDCFYNLARRHEVNAPILNELHSILYGANTPQEGIAALMRRVLKAE
jgi:glycerol-3-phosphate dehydrogenase (NAD(P)+)